MSHTISSSPGLYKPFPIFYHSQATPLHRILVLNVRSNIGYHMSNSCADDHAHVQPMDFGYSPSISPFFLCVLLAVAPGQHLLLVACLFLTVICPRWIPVVMGFESSRILVARDRHGVSDICSCLDLLLALRKYDVSYLG